MLNPKQGILANLGIQREMGVLGCVNPWKVINRYLYSSRLSSSHCFIFLFFPYTSGSPGPEVFSGLLSQNNRSIGNISNKRRCANGYVNGYIQSQCLTLQMDSSLPGSSVHGDFPGKNTGVDCHALLWVIFPKQGLNVSPAAPAFQADYLPYTHTHTHTHTTHIHTHTYERERYPWPGRQSLHHINKPCIDCWSCHLWSCLHYLRFRPLKG